MICEVVHESQVREDLSSWKRKREGNRLPWGISTETNMNNFSGCFALPVSKLRIMSQNYWVSGLCPSSGILNTRKHDVSETGSFSVLRQRERHLLSWVPQKELTLITKKKTPWSESASQLYRPGDRRFSAKWLPTFADRGCHVVSVTDPYSRILGFLDRSRYFSIK
jgi:hypothetical protein